MSSEKNAETASRKKYKASTRPAMVDADSGNNGVPDHISESACRGWGPAARGWPGAPLPAHHDEDERAQRENCRRAGEPHGAHHDQAVSPGHRVVVVAVEQQRIDRRAHLAGRRFDDAEAEIA